MNRKILKFQARAARKHSIPREQFLKLTPAEFKELEDEYAEEWQAENKVKDRRVAELLAAIYNAPFRKRSRRALTAKDFLPEDDIKTKKQNQSASALLNKTHWLNMFLNSKLTEDDITRIHRERNQKASLGE